MNIAMTILFWWLVVSAVSTAALGILVVWEKFRYGHVTIDEETGKITYSKRRF